MPKFNKPTTLNKIWALSGAVITPPDSKINQGWIVEAPGHQTENYLNNRHDLAIAHFNQNGFGEWDAITQYQGNFSWTLGSDGCVYRCKVTHTNQNPVTDVSSTYWTKVLNGSVVVTSPEISAYIKTLLNDADATTARTTLGMTTLGQNLVTSTTQAQARGYLGAGANGGNVFISPSAANSRAVIGVVSASDTTEGLSQRATDSEAVNGTNDTKFLTPKKLKLGFSVSLGVNGYIKFPSWLGGLTMQWGISGSNASANTAQTVIYPTPFNNLVFQVVATYSNDGAPSSKSIVNVYDVNNVNNFKYNHSLSGVHSIRWIAVGY